MQNEIKFEISIILINYNSSNYTVNCIKSILEKTSNAINFQIVIVDNASEIEDYIKLKSFFEDAKIPNCKLIRNTTNLGFGAGNMVGVKNSNSEYYAFINNDTILLNDCIATLLNTIKNNKNHGVCGPQAYRENMELLTVLDHFASPTKEFMGRSFLEAVNPKKYPRRKKQYFKPQQAEFISGSFMIVRAIDFNTIGGFDTNIFLYYEETDLCIRMSKINKFTFLVPDAKYIHFHGASTPKSIAIKTELKLSYLYVIKKHYGTFWHSIILNKLRIQYFIKSIGKPKYWIIFKVLSKGGGMSYSLKNLQ